MNADTDLTAQIKAAPDLPGVYTFKDSGGDALYVGKAASLKKRLSSYLSVVRGTDGGRSGAKVAEMIRRAETVEWIVVQSESEALIVEDSLIKRYRPPLNIRLRDDKSYPYIVITAEEEFPRVMFTRQPRRKGELYFGPYANAAKVRETLDILGRIFPFRKCRGRTPGRRSGSPCLQYSINRCDAPCAGYVTPGEYRDVINQVVAFLSGRQKEIARVLEGHMKDAAEAMEFERAALYRNRLEAVRHVMEGQRARQSSLDAVDIIGLARDQETANVQVFLLRDGLLADRRSFTLENVESAGDAEIFARFAAEYYSTALSVPREVIVPASVTGRESLSGLLGSLRGARVTVRRAERGEKRRLQELADHNAALALQHERLRTERSRERRYGALVRLQEILGLGEVPMRIEGYDVSNLGPDHMVASMVVFEGGAPRKSDYRKFAIRDQSGQDDFAALREVLSRRFDRAVDPEDPRAYDPSFEAVPDLVVVDGGKGQLNVAWDVLRELGLDQVVALISLAKREEEIFVPGRNEGLRLPDDDSARLLLQRLRDEAHRFAVGFHRARRQAAGRGSILDGLPGVGEKRKRAILQHFGAPERFLTATREEIEAVPGLPGKVAREVYDYIHKTG
ncbi:MAG: excinuclease ABC subunit UvrC [Thermoleophilia bacterium]